jgi:hypothetical protein
VIRRKPLSVLMWGVAYVVIAVLPMLLIVALGAQGFASMMAQMAANPNADPSAYNSMMMTGPLALLQPVGFLTSIAARAIVMNAVFRAVLEPEDDGFFYLRFGGAELWQGLVQLCYGLFVGIAAFALVLAALVLAGIAAVAAMAGGVHAFQPWMVLPCILVVLAVAAAVIWIGLRLSMAGPLTFMDRNFRLFESWTLTRGQAPALLGLAICLMLAVMAIEIVVGLIALVIVLLAAGGLVASIGEEGLKAFFAQPPAIWLPMLVPVVVAVAAIASVVTGYVFAIVLAPWAEACRQLRGEPPQASAPSTGSTVAAGG